METPSHDAYPAHWEADVVLRDGGTGRVRPITTDDAERLVRFYEQVSDESKYYRFFAPRPRLSDQDVRRFTHHDYVDRVGLAVTVGGEFIATVRYDRIDERRMPASAPSDEAEVAFLVQDAHQGRGVGSVLLEHIAAVARERGIRRFEADVLPANAKMIKVFRDAGFTQKRRFEDGSVRLTLDIELTAESLAVQRSREQRAEARSVQRLLAPRTVAVVGAGRAPGGVGRTVLRNILGAGFTGRTYAVNQAFGPDHEEIDGIPAFRSVAGIGEPVDLAILAVPAERVREAVADCGAHGVRALLVLAAGFAESGNQGRERERELVRQVRSYGMRVVGPNAFGIINTTDAVRLNASLAPALPAQGRIGLFTQSGAIGIALLSGLRQRGAGLSSFGSVGNRVDVSGNDFLQYWYEDPDTDLVLMYLESLGNARKFTRLARRIAAVKPVVVVKSTQHSGGAPPRRAAPLSRIPDTTVAALMRRAGVIQVDTVTEMVDVGLLLAGQPLPAGPRVAILGNSESLGLLTYDACLAEGLRPFPSQDLTTSATPDDFRAALAGALDDPACDAVVVTAMPGVGAEHGPTEDGVLDEALREAAANRPAKPVALVHVEIGGLAEVLSATERSAPARQKGTAGTTSGAAGTPSGAVGTTNGASGNTNSAGNTFADGEGGDGEGAANTVPPAGGEPYAVLSAVARTTEDGHAATRPWRIAEYPAPERAARALAEAVTYAQWRRRAANPGKVPEYEDIDEAGAAALIARLLRGGSDADEVSLTAAGTHDLLALYGIPVQAALPAPDPDAAVEAAARLGYPVALKTTAAHLRHRADIGGARLDLGDEAQLRLAYHELTETLGRPAELLPVVQAMAPRGVATVVRAVVDPAAGAVLSFGLAGVASELLDDLAHHLVPATARDAADLLRSIRTAPLLFGWRGSEPVDTPALEELLLRVSRLVDDHPEIVALTLEPVVVATHGLSVLGANARLAPPPVRDDLGPRRLPGY